MSRIANEIQPMIESNPDMPLPAIQDMLVKNHQVNVSIQKVFRAKRIATTRIIGDYREQYGILRSYCEALLRANPGSTIKIDCEPCANPCLPTRQFKRCYVCFASIMRGFKMCGREILGLDGCFMKGPFPGQILTAIGVDGNNGIYPVAYALVEAETFKSWEWFLELLKDDLGLEDSTNFTFISDRQKGLLLPPKHHKQVGRPQKKRKKSVGEAEVEAHFDSEEKMTRKGNTTKCSKCGNLGHNSRTCKGQGGENVENVVHAPSEDQVAGGENKTRKKCSKCGSLGHNSRTYKGQEGENVQESQTVSQGAPSESEA
ncbi:uncharacterized protein LOC110893954 [Helianthus annuus]|uniref:uncharacterized protein LOC110893954 n=1 Tax=Helianthus annuus TaxID=4232 RepID=UPI000B8FD444|nr:uncharacterized protein LOC110893954 [Helianthus annuus]